MQDTIIKYYVTERIGLKSNPDVLSETTNIISKGENIELIANEGDWSQIQYNNSIGYLPRTKLILERTITDPNEKVEETQNSNNTFLVSALIGFILLSIYLGYRVFKFVKALKKYSPLMDIEKEVAIQAKKKLNIENDIKSQKEKFEKDYAEAKEIYNRLKTELSLYQENVENLEYGIYEASFSFDTSEKFKEAIKEVRNKQKALVRNKNACICHTNWEVGGSKREGSKMVNRQLKITLKAFNAQCDALVSGVNWNNANRYIERLKKEAEQLNTMNEVLNITISSTYINLKIDELRLTQEYREKKYLEREIAREERAQTREEERAKREYEAEIKKAEKERKLFEKAIEEAKKQLGLVSSEELKMLEEKITDLQSKLSEAEERAERAISMAQITKRGHIYIISNIGSFGEGIYKIGMTRRLDPIDRVNELGDASVPFKFDVHAIIKSDNAPELEKQLHSHFDNLRVNKINTRREYFRVTLEEIEDFLKENVEVEYDMVILPEAKEYRETKYLENTKLESETEQEESYPNKLFEE